MLKPVEMLLELEKHFNCLCVEFKKLASIWLLSNFAGIGFMLWNDVGEDAGINDWTLTGLVGFGGSIGIFVIWVADLRVYQRLLSGVLLARRDRVQGVVAAADSPINAREHLWKKRGIRFGADLRLPVCRDLGCRGHRNLRRVANKFSTGGDACV